MPATNTSTAYGGIARSLHWLTALLILTALTAPLATAAALRISLE